MELSHQMIDLCRRVRPRMFVEATSFEQNCLWHMFAREAADITSFRYSKTTDFYQLFTWKNDNQGLLATIGQREDRPIAVEFMSAIIGNVGVIFWTPSSELVDHAMILQFLRLASDKCVEMNNSRPIFVDAPNFLGGIRNCIR